MWNLRRFWQISCLEHVWFNDVLALLCSWVETFPDWRTLHWHEWSCARERQRECFSPRSAHCKGLSVSMLHHTERQCSSAQLSPAKCRCYPESRVNTKHVCGKADAPHPAEVNTVLVTFPSVFRGRFILENSHCFVFVCFFRSCNLWIVLVCRLL